jgi:hypothetical protein
LRCPSCGRFSQVEGGFCIYCGARMPLPMTSLREGDVKKLRDQLVPIVNHKDRTDARISPLWVIIPFIGLTIATIAIVAVVFATAFAGFEDGEYDPDDPFGWESNGIMAYLIVLYVIVAGFEVMLAVLAYNLVRRHNQHFARERMFRDAIMSFSERSAGAGFQYSTPVNAETKRSPILWALVIAIPGVMTPVGTGATMAIPSMNDPDLGLFLLIVLVQAIVGLICLIAEFYLFYFLTVEMSNHHKRWRGFVRETKTLFGRAGYTAGGLSEPMSLPDRSMAVYIIVSLLTGVFIFYWMYAIVKDGNEHLGHHRHFEDQLIAFLSTRPSPGAEDQGTSISWA